MRMCACMESRGILCRLADLSVLRDTPCLTLSTRWASSVRPLGLEDHVIFLALNSELLDE